MDKLVSRIGGAYLMQIAIDLWNIVFLIGIIVIMLSNIKDRSGKSAYPMKPVPLTGELLTLSSAVLLYNTFDAVALLFDGAHGSCARVIKFIGEYGYSATGIFLMAFMLGTVRTYISDIRSASASSKFLMFIQSLQAINVLILLLNPITKGYFTIDENNCYSRSTPFFPIWSGINVISIISAAIISLFFFKDMKKLHKNVVTVTISISFASAILNMFFNGISMFCIGVSIITLYIFLVYSRNRTEMITENYYEIEKLRTGLILSQVRPHFIHNSITAMIYYADKDTEKTKKALENFSRYLRKNLDSANVNGLTTIDEEIEHARIYLSLEELRFGNDLKVEFRLGSGTFKLPVLTVQPLVENAVKHGIKNSENGCGTIIISTKETEKDNIITVIDNGAGFDTDILGSNDATHTGIRNVRSRLSLFCGGELSIESIPGEGTVCTITIPKTEDRNENTDN